MGLFDKLERKLEQTVNGAFAKAFRAEVQPVEIASAMRRAMDDRASSIGKNQRPIVPNVFSVELSDTDYSRLTAYREELSDELIASAMEHAETQRYTPGGPVAVTFQRSDKLETGVFRIRPSTAKHVDGLQDDAGHDDGLDDPARDPGLRSPLSSGTALPLPGRERPAPQEDRPARAYDERAHQDPGGYDDRSGRAQPSPGLDTGSASASPYSTGGEGYPAHGERYPADRYESSGDRYEPPAPPPPPRKRPQDRPWLDIDGERYPVMSAMTIIGRDDDADIILDDPGISRHHSEIRVTHDGPHLVVTLKDLGSTNGTFVNGDPISSARLLDGDRITVGRTAMTIHIGGRR
ncbi:DUF3662 and FHA domain-containing protein [Luteipulveratus sp. YIM 133132]|uniref:FhaA domain-containing protein n=1 Tax=Luteipulveratus flavus TaxID=3031728 RepID=UPI0023B172DB|nr:DUF3662 and FHA domain-containing protein [Luteipulveratus sp. YIM 133132]MDE9364397.1 DUF3662 and FHA domain-containing protein [Luteipulveratus sp. YIM 133132]